MEWFRIEDKAPPINVELIFKILNAEEDVFYLGKIPEEYRDIVQCCQCSYPEDYDLKDISHWAYMKFEQDAPKEVIIENLCPTDGPKEKEPMGESWPKVEGPW